MTLSWELGDQRHEVLAKTTELVVLIPQYMSGIGEHRSSCPCDRNMGWGKMWNFQRIPQNYSSRGQGRCKAK